MHRDEGVSFFVSPPPGCLLALSFVRYLKAIIIIITIIIPRASSSNILKC